MRDCCGALKSARPAYTKKLRIHMAHYRLKHPVVMGAHLSLSRCALKARYPLCSSDAQLALAVARVVVSPFSLAPLMKCTHDTCRFFFFVYVQVWCAYAMHFSPIRRRIQKKKKTTGAPTFLEANYLKLVCGELCHSGVDPLAFFAERTFLETLNT